MWDPYTGTSVMSYRGSSSQPRTLCFVRDDYVLTSASNKPLINVWSMQRQVITHCNSFDFIAFNFDFVMLPLGVIMTELC